MVESKNSNSGLGQKFTKINGNPNHHLYWRGPKIWVRFYKVGKGHLERSLKTNSLGEARIRRDQEIARFLGVAPKWQGKAFLVEDKFPYFLELKKAKSKRTYESISGTWNNHLQSYFGALRLEDVTESEWLRYSQNKLSKKPMKLFNHRKYLSMFLNWCQREGWIKRVPRLENVDPELNAGKVFADNEIKRLLKHSRGDLNLQIRMALTMGMRKSEILSLEWSQVDLKRNLIHLPAHKTKIRKARTFAISGTCLTELKKMKSHSDSDFVFPAKRGAKGHTRSNGNFKAWVACKEKAGVKGRFHDLRCTFLTKAFKTAVNPALVCDYAGLSIQEAQRTYLKFTPEDTKAVSNIVEIEHD